MNEQEMLLFAAKAAGCEVLEVFDGGNLHVKGPGIHKIGWNPIEQDADAFRLAVILALLVDSLHERAMPSARYALGHRDWTYGDNVRDAIVKCAAEIGKAMS